MATELRKTFNFNRPALHPEIATDVYLSLLASQGAIPLYFVDGVLTILIKGDVYGSGDVHNLYRVELTPTLSVGGVLVLESLVTPIEGDASDGDEVTEILNPHTQNMDTWLTAIGVERIDYGAAMITVIFITNTTLLAAQSGITCVNTGAAGQVDLTLPAAIKNRRFSMRVTAAFKFQFIAAGSDKIYWLSYQPSGGVHIFASEINAGITLECLEDGKWTVQEQPTGAWTIG